MRNFFIMLAMAALSAPAFAANADNAIDFDRGVNIEAYGEAMSDRIPPPPAPGGHISSRFTVGCHTFNLAPGNSSITTNLMRIESREYINECHYVPDHPVPPPPNNHHPQPNHGNNGHFSPNPGHVGHNTPAPHVNPPHHTPGPVHPGFGPKPGHKSISENDDNLEMRSGDSRQMICNERPGRIFVHNVRLNVGQRSLYPWEREEITVCAEHDRTWIRDMNTPYMYNVSERTQMGGGVNSTRTYALTPVSRHASAPDEDGLMATSFYYSNGKFRLNISDRWAFIYNGEAVRIHVELYRDRFLVDKSLGEMDFDFDTAGSYTIELSKAEMDRDVLPEENNVRGNTSYYVKWGFQRLGSISTDRYINKGSTNKVSAD